MKKCLITAVVTLMIASSVMAADTYTGAFFEAQQKKLDAQTNKIVDKERQLQQQQKNVTCVNKAKEQQDLVAKKKQQVQDKKDALKKDVNDIKDIFTIK